MSIEAMKQVIELYDKHCYNNDYGGIEFNKKHGYKFIEAIEALRTAIQQAESEPLTDTFVQTVPDKCDRILWRGRYLHLPIPNPAPGVPDDVVRDAERYRWLADCNNYEVGISILIDPKLTEHALGEAIDAAIDKAEGREA